jgi:hypothetical protein
MDVPPGPSEISPARKRWQLPLGFVLDGLYNLATNPYVRVASFNEGKFMKKADEELAKRGVAKDMPPEQVALKKKAIRNIIDGLRDGVPIPDDVRVTEVVGLYDPTMFSHLTLEEAKAQRGEHEGTLGAVLLPRNEDEPNRRRFGIKMGHAVPFFRENEIARLTRLGEDVASIAGSRG